MLFESVCNCGCYYKVFPRERLEEWSRADFPEKLKCNVFHLENAFPGKISSFSYETLENLYLGKYRPSLLDENGLVLGADRPECSLLTPSGLFHAGHPRQRNTQMIYFDQAEFDDNTLLECYLRLPAKVVQRL